MPSTLDNFINEKTIAVVDIETTGFSHQKDCIVEIGICELDLNSGVCRELFNKIIKEDHFSSHHQKSWIFENSDLKYEDVLNAKPLTVYKKDLQNIFDKYSATAYNRKFDFDYLINRGFIIRKLPCPMIVATDILKLHPKKVGKRYKWPKVEEAWIYYFPNKECIEEHRAYDDTLHEALIVYEMYKRNEWKPIVEVEMKY